MPVARVLLALLVVACFVASAAHGREDGEGTSKLRAAGTQLKANSKVGANAKGGRWCKMVRNVAGLPTLPKSCSVLFASGGSFIQLATAMRAVDGVLGVVKGYTGGYGKDVSYADVCRGKTGHAEAVLVAYDSNVTTYKNVVAAWLDAHDPTLGSALSAIIDDVTYYGSQFRSTLFVRRPTERSVFVTAVRAYRARRREQDGELAMQNFTMAARAVRFDGSFQLENKTDAELIEIRKSIAPDLALRNRTVAFYERRKGAFALVDPVREVQAIAPDDAAARALEKMDQQGKLAGLAAHVTLPARLSNATAESNTTAATPGSNATKSDGGANATIVVAAVPVQPPPQPVGDAVATKAATESNATAAAAPATA